MRVPLRAETPFPFQTLLGVPSISPRRITPESTTPLVSGRWKLCFSVFHRGRWCIRLLAKPILFRFYCFPPTPPASRANSRGIERFQLNVVVGVFFSRCPQCKGWGKRGMGFGIMYSWIFIGSRTCVKSPTRMKRVAPLREKAFTLARFLLDCLYRYKRK